MMPDRGAFLIFALTGIIILVLTIAIEWNSLSDYTSRTMRAISERLSLASTCCGSANPPSQ
jgi:hypothetical protein